MKNKIVVALDFDGTIIEKVDFPCIRYTFKKDAKKIIKELHKNGFYFILNTARYGWYRLPAIWFIWKHKLPVKIQVFNKKPDADIYIDDKNLGCKGIDWKEIRKTLLKYKEDTPCTK